MNLCLLSGINGCCDCSLPVRVRFYGIVCLRCGLQRNLRKEAHALLSDKIEVFILDKYKQVEGNL